MMVLVPTRATVTVRDDRIVAGDTASATAVVGKSWRTLSYRA